MHWKAYDTFCLLIVSMIHNNTGKYFRRAAIKIACTA